LLYLAVDKHEATTQPVGKTQAKSRK